MVDVTPDQVEVYGFGLVCASVCCDADASDEGVLAVVNSEYPTGLDHGWAFADDPFFASGEPNPCPCNREDGRIHRLVTC